jgi:hypothetical protein
MPVLNCRLCFQAECDPKFPSASNTTNAKPQMINIDTNHVMCVETKFVIVFFDTQKWSMEGNMILQLSHAH